MTSVMAPHWHLDLKLACACTSMTCTDVLQCLNSIVISQRRAHCCSVAAPQTNWNCTYNEDDSGPDSVDSSWIANVGTTVTKCLNEKNSLTGFISVWPLQHLEIQVISKRPIVSVSYTRKRTWKTFFYFYVTCKPDLVNPQLILEPNFQRIEHANLGALLQL